jgi:hypothetical protein
LYIQERINEICGFQICAHISPLHYIILFIYLRSVFEQTHCKEGREALSRAVALAVEATRHPKPVHGAQEFWLWARYLLQFMCDSHSKFWAQADDPEESRDEEADQEQSEPC